MTRTTLRFPLRLLDELYGSDAYDVAGDDLINALYVVEDYPGQFRADFQFDSGCASRKRRKSRPGGWLCPIQAAPMLPKQLLIDKQTGALSIVPG